MVNNTVIDAGHFVPFDPMSYALDAGTMPTQGMRLYSNNAKRTHNGRKAAKAQTGVTGGYVEGTLPTIVTADWACPRTPRKARNHMSANARKRAKRAAK